jgi:DNA-binding transcriptional MocR family regulator
LLPPRRSGLLLGYAGYGDREIRAGIQRLTSVLSDSGTTKGEVDGAYRGA